MNELEPYTPPLSIWKVVEESVGPEKLPVIRSCLGEAKIDYCNDLRFELETLLEIWNDIAEKSHTHPVKRASSLPEPPQQRELLTKEIRLLIKSLEEKEKAGQIVLNCKPAVLIYAKQNSPLRVSYSDRPSTPMRNSSHNLHTRSLNNYELSDAIKNVSVLDVDKSVELLKNALQNESEILTEDIEFLRSCVEEGHNFAVNQPVEEPSIAELRNERSKLEKQLLKDTVLKPKPKQEAIPYKASNFPSNLLTDMYDPHPPTPQTNHLPPVWTRSACGPSIRQHVSEFDDPLNDTDNVNGDNMHSTSAYEDFIMVTSTPRSHLLLGERSSTFPVKTLKKSSIGGLTRTKSYSDIYDSKLPAEYLTSSKNFERYYKQHSSTYCSKTDNGMSSRPSSRLAVTCDDIKCRSTRPSSVELSCKPENSVLSKSTVPNESVSTVRQSMDLDINKPKQYPSLHSVGSFRTMHNSAAGVLTYTAVPMPPKTEKPQNFGRLAIHRLRSANSTALKQ